MVNDRNVALPSGQARHVSFEKHGRRAELLFWFSDGAERHASIPRYWWQTMLRRLTCGRSGDEPVLVMLQSYDQRPVDWRTILDKDSPFLAL